MHNCFCVEVLNKHVSVQELHRFLNVQVLDKTTPLVFKYYKIKFPLIFIIIILMIEYYAKILVWTALSQNTENIHAGIHGVLGCVIPPLLLKIFSLSVLFGGGQSG